MRNLFTDTPCSRHIVDVTQFVCRSQCVKWTMEQVRPATGITGYSQCKERQSVAYRECA